MNTLSARKPAKLIRQLLAIFVASISAIVANVIFYFILKNLAGVEFIAPSESRSLEVSPLPYTDVIIFSIVFCVGASIVFLITANIARRAASIFVGVSIVVLILSLFMPLKIPTPPIPMATKLSLAAMHIVGAAVIVPLLVVIGLPITSIDPEEI
jgi:hypothetical protein